MDRQENRSSEWLLLDVTPIVLGESFRDSSSAQEQELVSELEHVPRLPFDIGDVFRMEARCKVKRDLADVPSQSHVVTALWFFCPCAHPPLRGCTLALTAR